MTDKPQQQSPLAQHEDAANLQPQEAPGEKAHGDKVHGAPAQPAQTSEHARPAGPLKDQGDPLDADIEAQLEKAMRSGAFAPEKSASAGAPAKAPAEPKQPAGDAAQPSGAPKPIRGPRKIEGGREHRSGVVVSVGPTDIFIEFGPKELGVLPRAQFPDDKDLPEAGKPVEVVVDRYDANESLFLCSRPGAVQKADWELLQAGQIVEARVTAVNKGGLALEVAGHQAFMPASLVDIGHIPDLSVFVGQKIPCLVQRIDRSGRGNIVLSRRDVLMEERKELRNKLRETLKEGDTVTGTIRKIMPYGAFVDIGGVDGLIHISDLSHERVHNAEKVVKEGQQVTVKVLKLDWENDRIGLGLKQTQADPFGEAAAALEEGATVTGRVTKTLEFGALVEVAPGVEGLVHISELAWKRVHNVEDVVKKDQVVTVKVLGVDTDKRRVSLSIKQTQESPRDTREGRGPREGAAPEKETPAMRRMREQAKQKKKEGLKSGLGNIGGMGLGDLKL